MADSDVFAARWTGQLKIDHRRHDRFYLSSDDGSRLFIDNAPGDHQRRAARHAAKPPPIPSSLDPGLHDIRVEYFENYGGAGAILRWDPPGLTGKEVIPAEALFRNARGVIDVVRQNDVVLSGFTGAVTAAAAGDVTPMIGSGLVGQFYQLGTGGAEQPDALSFDGNDRVEIASSASLGMTGSNTVEVRFRTALVAGGTWMPLIQKTGSTLAEAPYSLWINQGSGQVELVTTDANGYHEWNVGNVTGGVWHELATSIERTTGAIRVQLNGTQTFATTIAPAAGTPTSSPLVIGATLTNLYGGFVGEIDDVAIWNSVRSAQDIATDFAAGVDDAASSLAAHWTFDEASGATAVDGSANHNDGVLGGGGTDQVPARVQELPAFPDFSTLQQTDPRPEVVTLTAINAGPANGRIAANLALAMDVTTAGGTTPLAFTLTAASTSTNTSPADLATDLAAAMNAALSGAGFAPGAVSVAVKSGKLEITANDATITGITLHDATSLGFGAVQASITKTSLFIDQQVARFFVASDFAGFPALDTMFAAAWSGKLVVDAAGPVTLAVLSDDRSRLYIDGELKIDHAGLRDASLEQVTLNLTKGLHDIRFEYVQGTGTATAALAWDPLGGSTLELITADHLLRTDATQSNATAPGTDDLLIADDNGVRIVHGRSSDEWAADLVAGRLNALTLAAPFATTGSSAAIGDVGAIGDLNLDGRDDVAVLSGTTLTVYAGGGLPASMPLLSTITGLPAGSLVKSAGDVDGDTVRDLLITGAGSNYLIFGGNLPESDSLTNLLADPDGAGPQLPNALALPEGDFRAIDDFAKIDSPDELITDLNAALKSAGLGSKIIAEADGHRVKLTAIDSAITGFSLQALAGNAAVTDLHFSTEQTAADDGTGVLSLSTSEDAPEDGRLLDSSTGDVRFTISINGGAAVNVSVARADIQGNKAIGSKNRFDDLGAAALVSTDRLNEGGTLEHQVVNVYLGGPRATLTAAFAAPDLVFEPGRASFASPGTMLPDSVFFGPAVEHRGTDGITRMLLAVSGPAGEGLHVYDGQKLALAPVTTEAAPALAHEPEMFVFPLANPTAPGSVAAPLPGVDLANDASPRLRDAFALEGTGENEHLSQSISLADMNGDGYGELLVHGDTASYLLLGPVELDAVSDVAQFADVVIAADVGRPASRMGDVTGDGLADLVFLRPTTPNNFDLVIIAGGKANGVDMPRLIDDAWIDQTLLIPDQARVKVLHGSGAGFGESNASLAVLNWNDDGKADIALVRSDVPVGTAIQGYVFSGRALWGGNDDRSFSFVLDNPATTGVVEGDELAEIVRDNSDRTDAAADALAGGAEAETAAPLRQVRAIVAGDVTGDGLDDLLLSDTGYAVFPGTESEPSTTPNLGRAYLLTGRAQVSGQPAIDTSIDLATESELIIQDFSIGGSLSALGDLNGDGYGDFAVGSTREGLRAGQADTMREGGLFVFYGKADFGGEHVAPDSADIIVTRVPRSDLALDASYNGVLYATAGDFNGDNLMDLAVGEPSRVLTSAGSGQILDLNQSGSLSVFLDVSHGSRMRALSLADAKVAGQFEFDGFGVLPATPGFDLDGDGLSDLVVGSAGADVVTTEVIPQGGKAYVIYGSSSRAALPPTAIELGTRSFTGSGFFLVDEGTGRPTVFKDAPGETDPLFVLNGGADAWYRFTTLGDGMPGNAIRIVPGAQGGFVAPDRPGHQLSRCPADAGGRQQPEPPALRRRRGRQPVRGRPVRDLGTHDRLDGIQRRLQRRYGPLRHAGDLQGDRRRPLPDYRHRHGARHRPERHAADHELRPGVGQRCRGAGLLPWLVRRLGHWRRQRRRDLLQHHRGHGRLVRSLAGCRRQRPGRAARWRRSAASCAPTRSARR